MNRRRANDEAEEVRQLRARGLPLAEIAERFSVAKSSVSAIVHYHAPVHPPHRARGRGGRGRRREGAGGVVGLYR
ncbi:MAG: hypothetical protein BGO98_40355 [Myxococcales bacterium 68-20]|nr:hypothetical protein [Myxococcales bacterium]OJY16249.1 MAG: hypothetical protein BGO98_40355 [Myxococcales bacterium 68-20]